MTSIALDILHTVYSGPDAAKRIARDLGVSHRTTEGWWARRASPRADVFLRLAQSNAAMRQELLRRLGEHGYADTASSNRVAPARVGGASGEAGGLDRPAATGSSGSASRHKRVG